MPNETNNPLMPEQSQPEILKTERKKPQPESAAVTAKGYELSESEADLFHVELRKRGFDPNTGRPRHNPFIAKYSQRRWKKIEQRLSTMGLEVLSIKHTPAPEVSKSSKTIKG